jgi:deoxycytidylate deaminase
MQVNKKEILSALDELKYLSNYDGTRVAALALDKEGKTLGGNWCEDLNPNEFSSETVAHAEIRLLTQLGLANKLNKVEYLVVSSYPCIECMKAIISCEITKLVVTGNYLGKWVDSQMRAKVLFQQHGGRILDLVEEELVFRVAVSC